ncbi:hypothetical protein LTR84_008110 [Exophiala bonariae]|uniref:Uncharacterized protein n=1 Tax=Exophiala bonariae TaxID=1690606 RepID=A0AAV9NLY8_9EURO|nr:hypothetical protein LTR84_008110 [Exophiala bonariae]
MANPFMYPFGLPAMAPPPGFAGKTQYQYVTKDGGPPNQGKPPGAAAPPAAGGPPPPYSFFPRAGSCAPAPQAGAFFVPPSAGNPGMFCVPNGSSPAPAPQPPGLVYFPSATAPPPAPIAYPIPTPAAVAQAAARAPEPPVSGNRIKESLVVLRESGGAGYIASKHNATFHIFDRGLLSIYTPDGNKRINIPSHANEGFKIQMAACSLPMEEFIEQLDCIKDAPPNWPRSQIGIAELKDYGNGSFEVGTRIMLDDARSKETLSQVFGNVVGEAGLARPIYLTRIP